MPRGDTTDPKLWKKLQPLARQKRQNPTPAENALWQQLRNRQFCGVKFRRQHTIERFITDFAAIQPNLVIEVDGEYHQYTPTEDLIRQQFIESIRHYRVIRFTNDQVLNHMPQVLSQIASYIYLPTP